MEVMLEIYRTLKTLGMEWKEKLILGGLGGIPDKEQYRRVRGENEQEGEDDDSSALSVLIESYAPWGDERARIEGRPRGDSELT